MLFDLCVEKASGLEETKRRYITKAALWLAAAAYTTNSDWQPSSQNGAPALR